MAGISDAIDQLKNVVVDLTTLEVVTLTGDISATLNTTGGSVIDWKKVMDNATAAGGKTVTLVAATKIDFDGDSTLYVTSQPVPAGLLDAHKAAVESGQKVRAELVAFATGLFKKI